jgi:hypothetical protein
MARPKETNWDEEHSVEAEHQAVRIVELASWNSEEDTRRRSAPVLLSKPNDQRFLRETCLSVGYLRHDVDKVIPLEIRIERDPCETAVVELLPADSVFRVDVRPRLRLESSVPADDTDLPAPELRIEDALVRSCRKSRRIVRVGNLDRPEGRQLLPCRQRSKGRDLHFPFRDSCRRRRGRRRRGGRRIGRRRGRREVNRSRDRRFPSCQRVLRRARAPGGYEQCRDPREPERSHPARTTAVWLGEVISSAPVYRYKWRVMPHESLSGACVGALARELHANLGDPSLGIAHSRAVVSKLRGASRLARCWTTAFVQRRRSLLQTRPCGQYRDRPQARGTSRAAPRARRRSAQARSRRSFRISRRSTM